jgi:enterobactin synthetase component D
MAATSQSLIRTVEVSALRLPENIGVHQCPVRSVPEQLECFIASGIELAPSLQGAVLKRKVEYLAGRFCARAALRAAGCPNRIEVPINGDRSPAWPADWVGAISHCDDIAVAIAARASDYCGLGVDVERLPDALGFVPDARLLLTSTERFLLSGVTTRDRVARMLAFSLKESVFKCISHGEMLDFHDATIVAVSPRTQEMTLALRAGAHPRYPHGARLRGKCTISRRHVLTAVWKKHSAIEDLSGSCS